VLLQTYNVFSDYLNYLLSLGASVFGNYRNVMKSRTGVVVVVPYFNRDPSTPPGVFIRVSFGERYRNTWITVRSDSKFGCRLLASTHGNLPSQPALAARRVGFDVDKLAGNLGAVTNNAVAPSFFNFW
jgi:hypothetical protein